MVLASRITRTAFVSQGSVSVRHSRQEYIRLVGTPCCFDTIGTVAARRAPLAFNCRFVPQLRRRTKARRTSALTQLIGPDPSLRFFRYYILNRCCLPFTASGTDSSGFCFSGLVFMASFFASVEFVGLKSRVISNTSPSPLSSPTPHQCALWTWFAY